MDTLKLKDRIIKIGAAKKESIGKHLVDSIIRGVLQSQYFSAELASAELAIAWGPKS
jgi:hypothetical protein